MRLCCAGGGAQAEREWSDARRSSAGDGRLVAFMKHVTALPPSSWPGLQVVPWARQQFKLEVGRPDGQLNLAKALLLVVRGHLTLG